MKPFKLFLLTVVAAATATLAGRANSDGVATSPAQRCRPFVELRKQRFLQQVFYRKSKPKLAYRIMVFAILSYWDFHKNISSETGFTLLVEGKARKALHVVRKRAGRLKRLLSSVLQQGSMLPPAALQQDRPKKASNTDVEVDKDRIDFQYWLYDWYETGVAGVKFHDTDVLVGTFGDDSLVISFGGTASTADAVTNIQTFEPANHSGFYHGGSNEDISIQGSLHRGFLNAYARVDRGSVLRLCPDCASSDDGSFMDDALHQHFGHCTSKGNNGGRPNSKQQKNKDNSSSVGAATDDTTAVNMESGDITSDESANDQAVNSSTNVTSTSSETRDAPSTIRERRNGGGCFAKGKKLSLILQELATDALQQGQTVHVTGHSLGGGLASHLALDMVVNFPDVPVKKLHLWTFGAPQVADTVFFQSAVKAAPRLGPFVRSNGNGRLHRYVTLSDTCGVDVVSEVAKRALPSHRRNTLRGRVARRLGGVHGDIVHFAEPHYLLTPQQFMIEATNSTTSNSTTHSVVAAHATKNYLMGISRESRHHPLQTDLPDDLRRWVGEI